MLGQIIEEVAGQPFAEYVEEHVLEPLGMWRSTFDREAFEAASDRMTPYHKRAGSSTAMSFPFDPLNQPAGGLVGSVREMTDYVQVFLGGGTVGGETILSPGSVEAMTSPVGTVRTYFDGGEVGYGYGLDVEEYLGDTLVGHRGDIGVSSAWFGYLEDAKLGVVLACQTSPEAHPLVVGPAVLALLEGENPNEVVPHYRLVKAFETVSGEYEGYRAIVTATVEVDGGTLTFESENDFGGGQTLRLVPTRVEEDSLVCSTVSNWGRKEEVRFEFGGGEVDLFVADRRLRKSSHVGQS